MELQKLVASTFAFSSSEVMSAFEAAVLAQPGLRPSLCSNPNLTEGTWSRLFARARLSAEEALDLISRPLDPDRRMSVVKKERREKALTGFIAANNPLTEAELDVLVHMPELKQRLAGHLYDQALTSAPSLARELALRVGGKLQLHWLSTEESDVDSARLFLESFGSWGPPGRPGPSITRPLVRLLERFPSLISTYASSSSKALRLVAAQSRFLTSLEDQRTLAALDGVKRADLEDFQYTLLALVNNPVVSETLLSEVHAACLTAGVPKVSDSVAARRERGRPSVSTPFSEVDDLDTLTWLYYRAMPSDFRPDGRFEALAEVARNPNLPDYRRRSAALELASGAAQELLGPLLDEVWDVLVGLDASLGELRPTSRPFFFERELEFTPPYGLEESSRVSPGQVDAFLDSPPYSLHYASAALKLAASEVLGGLIGPRKEAWESFLVLMESFEGSIRELAQTAALL